MTSTPATRAVVTRPVKSFMVDPTEGSENPSFDAAGTGVPIHVGHALHHPAPRRNLQDRERILRGDPDGRWIAVNTSHRGRAVENREHGSVSPRGIERDIPVGVAEEARPARDPDSARVVQGFPGRADGD